MKIIFVNFLAVFCFILFSSTAKAELFIEPVGAFNFGKLGAEKSTITGTGWGGRLGYYNTGFHFGVDYLSSTFSVIDKSKDGDDDNNDDDVLDVDEGEKMSDAKLHMTEYAAFVGLKLPAFFRFYAGYIFSAEGDIPKINYKFSSGRGTKYGISFTGIPFLNINFEYRNIQFGDVSDGGDESTEDQKARIGNSFEAYAVTLSLPFSI